MFLFLTLLLYMGAAGMLGLSLWQQQRLCYPGIALGISALILHFVELYPLLPGSSVAAPGNIYSLTLWTMALLLTLIQGLPAARPLAVLLYPLTALSLPLISRITDPGTTTALGFRVHLGLSVLTLSVVVLAGLQALILFLQERSLQSGQMSRLAAKLPPLQESEGLLFKLIALAFFLLSLSLASGLAYPADLHSYRMVHKTVLALLAWIIFGALLGGRLVRGWRGLVAARWALWGSLTLLLAYFGSLWAQP